MPASAARTTVLLVVLSVTAGTASAQSMRDQLVALSDGLNDPDPIIRLVTYEEAVQSENATIRRVALRTALQSTDSDLRTLALRGALKGRETLSFKLSRSPGFEKALEEAGQSEQKIKAVRSQYKSHAKMLAGYSSVMPMRVLEYDYSTGKIKGACMVGVATPNDAYSFSGTISGDELTMTSKCAVTHYGNCSLSAELGDDGKLVGILSCPYNTRATAVLDLL